MTDEDKRRWAIEQAIALHSGSGVTTDALLNEAKKLLEFVDKVESK